MAKIEDNRQLTKLYQRKTLFGRSLLLFSPSNELRVLLAKLVQHPFFDHFMMAVIVASCVVLCFETPTIDTGSQYAWNLRVCDYVLASIYGGVTQGHCVRAVDEAGISLHRL